MMELIRFPGLVLKRTRESDVAAAAPRVNALLQRLLEPLRHKPKKLLDPLRRYWPSLLLLVVPMILASIYYGFIASDIYISEAKFVIRQPEKSKIPSSLGMFLQSAGMTSAHEEIFTVREFMVSRDAMKLLDDNLQLRKVYSKPNIDFLHRFNPSGDANSLEDFYEYYKDIVSVDIDTSSSICAIKIKAFTPQTAHSVNEALLFLGEGLINELNARAQRDLVRFYKQELDEAEVADKRAALALSVYRNQQMVFDPKQQSSMQLEQVGKLEAELIAVRGQLAQYRSFAASSPYIAALEKRRTELEKEIGHEMSRVAGNKNSMTQKLIEYERLSLERDFMDKRLAAAMSALQQARTETQRQLLYLEKIVTPNMPDKALYPRRGLDILLVLITCLALYGLVRLFIAGVKEHRS